MGLVDGRVCVVTGAGRGLGREHALQLAAEGAKVVVNDLGGDGANGELPPAEVVAREIIELGGEACASTDDVTTAEGADRLLETALSAFGDVHGLVNNAGILRDRTLINMSDAEFDDVNRVHMRGHFCATRAIARHWREAGATDGITRTVVNTSSGAGLYGNPGQTNYSGAKAAIAAYTQVWAKELQRYGARVNAISPLARTRLTEVSPQVGELMQAPAEGFDFYHPGNASPLVVYLSSDDCQFNGHLFYVQGDQVSLMRGWGVNVAVTAGGTRWTASDLSDQLQALSGEAPVGEWETITSFREKV